MPPYHLCVACRKPHIRPDPPSPHGLLGLAVDIVTAQRGATRDNADDQYDVSRAYAKAYGGELTDYDQEQLRCKAARIEAAAMRGIWDADSCLDFVAYAKRLAEAPRD